MVQVVISNTSPRVGYSSSLKTSCVSLQFWSAHEVISTKATPTVSYCVTVPTPELVYTTPLDFYVCELQDFDVILGEIFRSFCLQSHCEHPPPLSPPKKLTIHQLPTLLNAQSIMLMTHTFLI